MLTESNSGLGLLQTRCPSCQKLFAIDPLPADLNSALYQCTNCATQFTIELGAPEMEPDQQTIPAHQSESATAAADFEANQIASEIALGAKPELILLWKKVIDDYEDDFNHESFVQACTSADALGYAAHKYNRILKEFPGEEIAKKMSGKIQTIASSHLDAAKAARLAAQAKFPTTPSTMRMMIPSLSLIAILLSAILTVVGLMVPGMKSLTGVGLSMLALTLGVRYVNSRSAI